MNKLIIVALGFLILTGCVSKSVEILPPDPVVEEAHGHEAEEMDMDDMDMEMDMDHATELLPDAETITIVASEFGFSPDVMNLVAGEPVNIVLVNEGIIEHEIEIEELGFHLHAKAGDEVSGVLTAPEDGEYEFGCFVEGHYESGMVGTVSVGHGEEGHHDD